MRALFVRRPILAAALVCAVLVSLSCGGDSGSPSPTPNSILVAPGADTLISIGSHRTFTAQVLDGNGDPIDGKTVTWSSSAPGILSIDPTTGVATAVANGPAVVHAASGTLQGSANVIVLQLVAKVTVTPANAAFTAVGDTQRFTAVAKDSGGTVVPGVQILWTTSDNGVATIDTLGLAKAKGAGTALVSAQGQARAGYAAIGVDPTVTQFAVIGAPTTGVAGDIPGAALQVELRDANGNRAMNSSLAVTVAPAGAAAGTPLHGATTVLADQGRATFANLWFEKAGIDRFKITVAALPADSGSLVTVAPAVPARVRLDTVPQDQVAGVPIGLVGRVYDRFGNLATNFAGPVHAYLTTQVGVGPTSGDSVVDAVAGVASFPALNFHVAAAPYFLTADLPGLSVQRDTTIPMVVLAAPPASIVTVGPATVSFPFVTFTDSTRIQLLDAYGNQALSDNTSVAISATGWSYTSPPAYALQIVGQNEVVTANGRAVVRLAASRPGLMRVVFSAAGLIPDTTDVVGVHLPNALFPSVTDASSCITGRYCSGDNTYGQLGVDPVAVTSDSLFLSPDSLLPGDFALVDGGARHTCAELSVFGIGLQVTCWGDNTDGQLGGGSVGGSAPNGVVVGIPHASVSSVSAGGAHSCAILDGETQCWGRNDVGQLGTGVPGASTGTPTTVTGGHTFAMVAAGGRHTCAIDDTGHMWCWGANDFGQLGDSGVSGSASATPVAVFGGKTWTDVSAGKDFTCASTNAPPVIGVFCWGRNDKGQVGPSAADSVSLIPVLAKSGFGVETGSLAAGADFACAPLANSFGEYLTYCWGANDHGQLGRGTVSPFEPVPNIVATSLISSFPALIRAGSAFACGITRDATERYTCWGRNDRGQFGSGKTGDFPTPIIIQEQY